MSKYCKNIYSAIISSCSQTRYAYNLLKYTRRSGKIKTSFPLIHFLRLLKTYWSLYNTREYTDKTRHLKPFNFLLILFSKKWCSLCVSVSVHAKKCLQHLSILIGIETISEIGFRVYCEME